MVLSVTQQGGVITSSGIPSLNTEAPSGLATQELSQGRISSVSDSAVNLQRERDDEDEGWWRQEEKRMEEKGRLEDGRRKVKEKKSDGEKAGKV
ncbi:hypothetical protein E2C01_068244 [Portunus trituberculatus]|uniref:Uncharacterized protein n=1 Tax=Portunus trituberculatus TaxID=210409 RepID=A0A5B7HRE5_PORTR|nr:hypothetical protein [Portunus trituberculatus]